MMLIALGGLETPKLVNHHQGILQILKTKMNKTQYCWEVITCDPTIYTRDHPDLTVLKFVEKSIGPKRVKI